MENERAICSRKDRSAIVWDTAASRWNLDLLEALRLRSHPMRIRCRPVGLESKADWKVCRCWADAARSDSGLAFPSSRGTSQRETASDTVASLCNPAVPEAPPQHSGGCHACRLVRIKIVGLTGKRRRSRAAAKN